MANRVKVIKDVAFYSRLNRKYVLCCCYITTTLYKKGSESTDLENPFSARRD